MSGKKVARRFNLAMVVLGIALFVVLLVEMDAESVGEQLRIAGWSLLPAFAFYLLNLCASTMSWRETVQPGDHGHRPPFSPLLKAFWAGHGINGVGIAAAGEVVKGNILARVVKGEEVVASLVIYGFINMATEITTTVIGAGICLLWLDLPRDVIWVIFAASLAFCVGILLLRWLIRARMAGRLVRLAGKLPFVNYVDAAKIEQKAEIVDERIRGYRKQRPASFRRAVAWAVVARVLRLGEFVVLLYALLPDRDLSFLVLFALLTQTTMQLITWSLAFIPGRVGVLEGGSALLFELVGLGPELGLSVAILRRVRRVAGLSVGLVIAAKASAFDEDAADPSDDAPVPPVEVDA